MSFWRKHISTPLAQAKVDIKAGESAYITFEGTQVQDNKYFGPPNAVALKKGPVRHTCPECGAEF